MTIKGLGVLIGIKKIGKWAAIVAGAIAIVIVMPHYIGNCNAEKMDARIESLKAAAGMEKIKTDSEIAAAKEKAKTGHEKTDELFMQAAEVPQGLVTAKIKPKPQSIDKGKSDVTRAEYDRLQAEYLLLSDAYNHLIVTNQEIQREWIKKISELSRAMRAERDLSEEVQAKMKEKYDSLERLTKELRIGYNKLYSTRHRSPFRLGLGLLVGKSLFPKGGAVLAGGVTLTFDTNIIK